MKFQHNPRYTAIAIYALLVLVAAMIFFEAFQNIEVVSAWLKRVAGYLQPFVNGLVFAFLLNPMLRAFDDRLLPRYFGKSLKPASRRAVALLLTYIIALTAIVVFVALVLPQIVTSVGRIGENLQNYFGLLEDLYADVMRYINERTDSGDTEFRAVMMTFLSRLLETVESLLGRAAEYLSTDFMRSLLETTQRITTGILNLFLGVFVSVYLLLNRETLFAQSRKLLAAIFPDRASLLIQEVATDANRILSGFVVGKVIDSVIIGVMCFVGMTILRMGDYAAIISVIVGVTNVIPYFGPFIGAIPSAIILLVENPMQAVWFLIFILLLQQFDGNILGPKILGDSIGISALWVMFSIMLFSGLMGVAGMFIGVPLFAIIYQIVKRIAAFLLARKGKPTATREYASEKNPLIK
ncbi:MAG: AI-2E family transporter [Oscillospiraceae bacterium]|jgi:predicted PurR-regulated permease PerM|nr:AI-2E family transporter [Oscillospiraceae bacterium]